MFRRTLLAAAIIAAVGAIPASQAADAPRVSLAVSSFEVVHGDSIVISGRVGNRQAGIPVTLLAKPFTRASFRKAATAESGAGGAWSIRVSPSVATAYKARAGGPMSRMLTVGVRPAIGVTMKPNGRLEVRVEPNAFAGRFVRVQEKRDDGSWANVLKAKLGSRSGAAIPPDRLPDGARTLRVALSVNQAGAGWLGASSAEVSYPTRWASLTLKPAHVAFGEPVQLTGLVSARKPGVAVTILVRPVAQAEFQQRATVSTGKGGRWSYSFEPWVSAAVQARFGASESRVLTIGVRPVVSARVVSEGRVWAKVDAGRSLSGRSVQLQQRQGDGTWKTVARARLDPSQQAIFPVASVPGGSSTLRVSMSVNQAGAGYLGGFSRPFAYQR